MGDDIKFNDLLFKALDHAVDSIAGGGVLVPFVMTDDSLQRFLSDTFEEGRLQAERYVAEHSTIPRIALAYDGFLVVEGMKSNAIYVKAFDRATNKAIVLAQRYRNSNGVEKIGNPVLVEQSS